MDFDWSNWIAGLGAFGTFLKIIGINIVLSGDNAVVIALACRGLRGNQRRLGMILGAGVAVVLRILFTFVVVWLMGLPFLRIIGALLLFWIAVKLLLEEEEDAEGKIAASDRLWHAVRTVAIADIVMSLDNVIAIAGVAQDSYFLLMLGLGISIPLIVIGASLLTALLDRFPILVWAGAGLLGWVAGEMLISDPWLTGQIGDDRAHSLQIPTALVGAVIVVALGYLLRRRLHHSKTSGSEVSH